MKAKTARFYGWSYSQIEKMPVSLFYKYYEAITVIESQEILLQMQVSDYPQMKQESRKSFHKKIFNLAYPRNNETKILTSKDMALILGKELS
jgi:hypothetical protein